MGEKTKTFGLTGAIRYQNPMQPRRVVPLMCALCAALIVACAGGPPRTSSTPTSVANPSRSGSGAATPTPLLLSGSGPEEDISSGPTTTDQQGAPLGGATPIA